ncbi:ABC transporter substrate-binding protein [Paenibacillus radicis (ex Xue et al. 2023)]|uniref:ABC transporter substrate-binding protein n=1 Tax=Paenibacillus radicis (ex Xue et al. 2023) TaxID=2972489 RepID=A0ABT1YPV1_9BACL|nr:ABC transporter substrate-binding protein [Paenibacillus radicis (ex Xue et al. 2023)]MCR8635206.1 ABC transporter substrate-binding protein [Paenibacillus radicis (ex Xue et al. 2023)]
MSTKWKVSLALILASALAASGCSQRPEKPAAEPSNSGGKENSSNNSSAKKTLSMMMNVADQPVQDVYRQIINDFIKENPSIGVNIQFPGSAYENNMKVKMAANDLPDIFDTHGWAQVRYGEYLGDLREEPWVKQLTDTIKNVVTDKNGKVYALPISEAKDGIMYNVEMLKKYNVEPPQTFDELVAAAEKIKKDSGGKTTPFFFSGIDESTIGTYFGYFANALLISPASNSSEDLLKNTFDWSKWTPLPDKLLDIKNRGLINEDFLTAKRSELPAVFAAEKVAFALLGPSFVDAVNKIKPDMKVGLMPIPAMSANDKPSFSGGERNTLGVWKDSKNIPEAKKLMAFFAKPENLSKIANVTKLQSGLKGIESKHELTEYYDKYANVRVLPYFDRVYLPNGMWSVMSKSGTELLAGRITSKEFSETMKREVERLRKN